MDKCPNCKRPTAVKDIVGEAGLTAEYCYRCEGYHAPGGMERCLSYLKWKLKASEQSKGEVILYYKFLLQDLWPYVHQYCTIETIKSKVIKELFGRDK